MIFDMAALADKDRYKLLASTIVPRPIAWITSLSPTGVLNAAPFSFFNMMGSDPPTVAVGIMPDDGRLKDTATNIRATGEFVINLVSERNAEAMNLTCIDAPPDVDELTLAGLTALSSTQIAPPRIGESPVAFECRLLQLVEPGPMQTIVIGQVLCAHIDDAVIEDASRCHIDPAALRLIARTSGAGGYIRTADLFNLQRPKWAERTRAGAD